ncbi:MAG TPA: hypothetical protein VK171_16165, partial [Fimbriimonas sp.]|nr:hypothetical protein [Fimbriimonas sp.]
MDDQIWGIAGGLIGVIAFLALFAVVIIVALTAQKKRVAELSALAARLGFEFYEHGMAMPGAVYFFGRQPSPCPHEPNFVPFFDLFQHGSSRTIRPAIIGMDGNGTKWHLIDYRY